MTSKSHSGLSVVVVHHHGVADLLRAVPCLEAACAAAETQLELIVVDNGSTTEESSLLASLEATVIPLDGNPGFAVGVNRGFREATREYVAFMNPDVFVEAGCISALIAAHKAGLDIVGPRFFWDSERRLILPPTEPRGATSQVLLALGRRYRLLSARARRHWRAHAWRFWNATGPVESAALSGGLVLTSRQVWKRAGPLDEGFRLYFEETDWLLRARQAGLRIGYVPAAAAHHPFGQSTRNEPAAGEWFVASSRRFRRRHHGRFVNRWLERLESGVPKVEPPFPCTAALDPEAEYWLELSPHSHGLPSAAERLTGARLSAWQEPADLALPSSGFFLRVVDPRGNELGRTHELFGSLEPPAIKSP